MSNPNENTISLFPLIICSVFFIELITVNAKYTIDPVTPPVKHGVNPFWSEATGSVYFVDRIQCKIYRFELATEKFFSTFILGDFIEISFIVPIDGMVDTFAVGIESLIGIYVWDGESNATITTDNIIPVSTDDDFIYIGKTDIKGQLWVATYHGSLYLVESNKKVTKMLSNGVSELKGIAWSLSGKKLYRANADPPGIVQFDCDVEKRFLSPNATEAVNFEIHNISGIPDDITLDISGSMWITLPEINEIIIINPENGTKYETLPTMTNDGVKSITFGGWDLNELYVTTIENESWYESGRLFRVTNTSMKGLPSVPAKIILNNTHK